MSLSNYPDGAANDPRAPYNQVDAPELEFEKEFASTMTLNATLVSNEYEGGYRDEEGYYEKAIYTGDAVRDFKEGYYTITEILDKFIDMAESKIASLQSLISVYESAIPTYKSKSHKLRLQADIMRWKSEVRELTKYNNDAHAWIDNGEEIEEI